MVEDQVVSLVTNLAAAGVTTSTGVSVRKSREILRRRRYSQDLNDVATTFMEALERGIEAENDRRDTKELEKVTDDWEAIVKQLSTRQAPDDENALVREREQLDILFRDEEEAVKAIAEAIASVKGYDLTQTPELRDALEAAISRAYREAVVQFEKTIAGTDLADVFVTETNIQLTNQVQTLQDRLAEFSADVESLLTQQIRDEGFRELTPSEFALGPDPRPVDCWRTGFTLTDVQAGFPAKRVGQSGERAAIEELIDSLREGSDCIVVGGPGSGKSTLCKQVAIDWYNSPETGPVFYRESGAGGGSEFESVDTLKRAVTATDAHTLVVVEDALQPGGNAIFEVIEQLSGYDDVSFLLDDLQVALTEFEGSGPIESSLQQRQKHIVDKLHRYHLPRLSVEDIQRVLTSFEAATGYTVKRTPESLYEELYSRTDIGIGEMLLLSFLLPIDDGGKTETGLERNVRNRYETLKPDSETALRDLSRFDQELLADVGVMVTLLNASGIGIRPELVHSIAWEYGHDWETHDEIADIRATLEGWFLYESQGMSTGEVLRTTHRLWSTLYLRELALDHEDRQRKSRRRTRSERRFARCLLAIFALFDDADARNALSREFPDSPLLAEIDEHPAEMAEEYLTAIFEMGQNWPALAALFGMKTTACYDLPEKCPDSTKIRAVEMRGHAQRLRGLHAQARIEYQHMIELATTVGDEHAGARGYNNLGLVAEAAGEIDTAREQFQQSLARFHDLDDSLGEAMCLSNLGLVARKAGDLAAAQDHTEESLALFQSAAEDHIEAACLGNLGMIVQARGDLRSAQEYFRRSLELARSLNDRHAKAEVLTSLGLLSYYEGNFETATEYVTRGLKIERELGNRQSRAKALGIRALIAREQERYEDARDWYEDALDLCRQISDTHTEAALLGGLAMLDQAVGDRECAHERIQRSYNLYQELNDQHAVAETLGLKGVIELDGGHTTGREKLAEALAQLDSIGAHLTAMQLLKHHVELEYEQGNHERVRELYERASELANRADADLGFAHDQIEHLYHSIEEQR